MKKNRNYQMPMMYQGAIPVEIPQMPMPINYNCQSQDISSIQNQLSALERRISNLENSLMNNSYSSSNYQMM